MPRAVPGRKRFLVRKGLDVGSTNSCQQQWTDETSSDPLRNSQSLFRARLDRKSERTERLRSG